MNDLWIKNKTVLLYVILPLICVLGIIGASQQHELSPPPSVSSSNLNTSLHVKIDSGYKSKAEAYDAKNDEQASKKNLAIKYGVKQDVSFDLVTPVGAKEDPSKLNSEISKSAAEISSQSQAQRTAKPAERITEKVQSDDINRQLSQIDKDAGIQRGKKERSVTPKETRYVGIEKNNLANKSVIASGVEENNGFHNLNFDDGGKTAATQVPIKASIKGSVMRSVNLSAGQTVTIRTLESGTLHGVFIPKNTIMSGITQTGQNRLTVNIIGIEINGQPSEINLNVYDQDGMAGIRAPGSAAGASAKQSVNDQIDNADATATARSGAAGIIASAGGSLIKAIRGTTKTYLPEGYRITLR